MSQQAVGLGATRPDPEDPAQQAAVAVAARPAATALGAGPSAGYAGPEQSFAVTCSDGPNPRHASAYTAAAHLAYARSGQVGGLWANPSTCSPGTSTQAAYLGRPGGSR